MKNKLATVNIANRYNKVIVAITKIPPSKTDEEILTNSECHT